MIVTVLFWAILCLDVTSDIMGNVVFGGQTFEGALQVVHLNENLRQAPEKLIPPKLEGEGPAWELIAEHEREVVRQRREGQLSGLEALHQVRGSLSART